MESMLLRIVLSDVIKNPEETDHVANPCKDVDDHAPYPLKEKPLLGGLIQLPSDDGVTSIH
jgi:hypothetical protein